MECNKKEWFFSWRNRKKWEEIEWYRNEWNWVKDTWNYWYQDMRMSKRPWDGVRESGKQWKRMKMGENKCYLFF